MKKLETSEKIILFTLSIIGVIAIALAFLLNKTAISYNFEENLEIVPLKNENRYLTISSSIDKYISSIKYKDIDSIMNILDKKYIEEHKIKSTNVLDLMEKYKETYAVNTREIYQIKRYNNIYVYYARAKLIEEEYDSMYIKYIKDVFYRVTINENDISFAVAPIDKDEYFRKVGEANG